MTDVSEELNNILKEMFLECFYLNIDFKVA